jgi:hypothetical protein
MTSQPRLTAAGLVFLLLIAGSAAAENDLPRLLPDDLETALALSAAPASLRPAAGVHLLRRGGYEKVRAATNHFDCFVVRSVARFDIQSADTLIPICLDDEGMRAIAPVHFDTARMREAGHPISDIRSHLMAGFNDGTYRAPARGGLSYMISPILNLPDGEGGVWTYPPHFMIYAPHLTNAQQDTQPDRGGGWLPWINNEGPHGMIIVPVGTAEREIIRHDEADLIQAVEDFLIRER